MKVRLPSDKTGEKIRGLGLASPPKSLPREPYPGGGGSYLGDGQLKVGKKRNVKLGSQGIELLQPSRRLS